MAWAYTRDGSLVQVQAGEPHRLAEGVHLTPSGKGFVKAFATDLLPAESRRDTDVYNFQQSMKTKLAGLNRLSPNSTYKSTWKLTWSPRAECSSKTPPSSSIESLQGASLAGPTVKEQHDFLEFAKHYQFDKVRELVKRDNEYVNCQPEGRWTALHQACGRGDEDMVQFLLDNGADVKLTNREKQTPKDVAKASLQDGGKDARHREYRACVALIDYRLLAADISMGTLRSTLDTLLCTEVNLEVVSIKELLPQLEMSLSLELGTLMAYKEGIKAEVQASVHRLTPSRASSVTELHSYHVERLEVETNWSEVLSTLLEMHTLIVNVPMLRKTPKLMTYLKKKGDDLAKLPPDDNSWTKDQKDAHKCAGHLHALWKKHGKKSPTKCDPPEFVEGTDEALTFNLKLPPAETEITAVVVTYKPAEAPKSQKPKEARVPQELWQGKATGEQFTWTLCPLDPSTLYEVKMYACGTEDCWQKGTDSKSIEIATLKLTTVAELKVLNTRLGECTVQPINMDALSDLLWNVSGLHATLQVIKESSFISTKANLHKAVQIGGDAGESAKSILARFKQKFKKPPQLLAPILVHQAPDRLNFVLIVPRSEGVISSLEWRIKVSEAAWPQTAGWHSIDADGWRDKPPGVEIPFTASDLQPATVYDVQVRAKSDDVYRNSDAKTLTEVRTLPARPPLSKHELERALEDVKGVLDDKMQFIFNETNEEKVKTALSTFEGHLVSVSMLKESGVRKLLNDLVKGTSISIESLDVDKDSLFQQDLIERVANLQEYWKSTIKSAPRAPTLSSTPSLGKPSLTVTVPDASTDITSYEAELTIFSPSGQPTRVKLDIPPSAWEGKSTGEAFEWPLKDDLDQPSATFTVKGDDDPMGQEDESPLAAIKPHADAFIESVWQLADGLGTDSFESSNVAFFKELEQKLGALEAFEPWTVTLLKETSVCPPLRRFMRIDTTGLDEADHDMITPLLKMAEALDSRFRALIKPPPQKIKEAPLLVADGASQTSLKLTATVPAASTRITAFEVQVITYPDGQKHPPRWIPEEAWKDKMPGYLIEWLVDDLDAGSSYAISVRAYGTEEECFMRTKHWSPELIEHTLRPDGEAEPDAEQVDMAEQAEQAALEAGEVALPEDEDEVPGEMEGTADEMDVEAGAALTPASKAFNRISKSFKDAAVHVHNEYYKSLGSAAQDSAVGMCKAVRQAMLVRPVAEALGGSFDRTELHVMELAMLYAGGSSKTSTLFKEFMTSKLELPSDFAPLEKCIDALQRIDQHLPAAGKLPSIELVFKVARDLDEQQPLALTQPLRKKVIEQATDALRATGKGTVLSTCGNNPAHCITVVQKAHKVREQLAKKLTASFPNLDKFQERVLKDAVEQAASKIANEVPLDPKRDDQSTWLSKQAIGCPSDWIAHQVVEAQEKVLSQMSDTEKKAELKGEDSEKPLMSHVFKSSDKDEMSKDLPEDSEAFAVMKQKLILSSKLTKVVVAQGEPSKAWSELVTSNFRHGSWNGRVPGYTGFNKFAQEMMESRNVPDTKVISVPSGGKPCVQPYQQVAAYLAHPKSYTLEQTSSLSDPPSSRSDPSQRMLVVHRTGAGKTCSMIRIADNYFDDKRPKILLFPSPAVCSNFYMELLNHRFPNRYADYLQREGKLDEVRNNLELKRGGLMCGRVRKEYLNDPLRPSAPLRAFSYTQAGGRQACGDRHRINPVFKCPDGYGGGWCYGPGERYSKEDGYEEYESDGNPFSNKIILMDEFHNLVKPSPEICKSPMRMMMLDMLKEMLRTAKNSVIVGFTATPLVSADGTAKELLDIIKGKGNEHLTDEGFVSYFMGSPSPVFPIVVPPPNEITENLLRKVALENLSEKRGNLKEYYKHESDELKAVQRCSLGQYFGTAGRLQIFDTLKGAGGKLCGEPFDEEDHHDTLGYCPDRVRGYASKLAAVCDDVSSHAGKTLVLVHSAHGFKLLLRLLDARFPSEVLGYVGCNASATAKWDDELKALIGDKHNEAEKAKGCCGCHICKFNAPKNLQGEEYRIMVADAKFCSEGVSFFGVRQLALVDMPENAAEFVQRVGRAVRFNGHAGLPPEKSNVRLRLYCATLPAETGSNDDEADSSDALLTKSADERRLDALTANLKEYEAHLRQLQLNAVDFDCLSKKPLWDESSSDVDFGQAMAAQKDALDKELALEADAIKAVKSEAAKAKAEAAKVEAEAKAKAEAAKVEASMGQRSATFADSRFRVLYEGLRIRESQVDGNDPIGIEELWQSAESLVAHYEGPVVTSRFIEGLQNYVRNFCYDAFIDDDDVKTVAELMWSAGKFGGVKSELCSLLNRAIREDSECPDLVLKHAVLITRAINKNLVASVDDHAPSRISDASSFKEWPNGPQADINSGGWSSNKNTTWRGGGMPAADLQWYLDLEKQDCKKFRTMMFVASSFSRSKADYFSKMRYDKNDPDGTGKVLFKLNFERHNCLHVNYIDRTSYPQEKEFLLPPYSALELVRVQKSHDLDQKPHVVEVNVLPDNQGEALQLPLAKRI